MAQQNNSEHIVLGDDMQDFVPSSYTGYVWRQLKILFNNNEIGLASFMGNMYQESRCVPYLRNGDSYPYTASLQYTAQVNDGTISRSTFIAESSRAYGLCQWYSSNRKAWLYDSTGYQEGPPTTGSSIGDMDRGIGCIFYELQNHFTDTLDAMINAIDINIATEYAFNHYFIAGDSSLPQRQRYASQILAEYGTGGNTIFIDVNGNGVATVDNYHPLDGERFILKAIPNAGETLDDITAETSLGQSIAMQVVQEYPYTYNEQVWGNYIIIHVEFSGTTPPPPPPPPPTTYIEKKHMPIWMYPLFRFR